MERMIRKQIYIRKGQQVLLAQQAKLRGVSHSELLRRALDQMFIANIKRSPQTSHEAFAKFEEFITCHRSGIVDLSYHWNREDT